MADKVLFNPIKEPTNALETLGTILTGEELRDAIHLAVVAMVASEKLFPGQRLNKDGGTTGETIGIVDPFLRGPVMPGQHFWFVIDPRTITSLRHVWTHPDFPDSAEASPAFTDPKAASEQWLRDFIARSDCPGYEEVMGRAAEFAKGNSWGGSENSLHFGEDAMGEIPNEFWDHFAIVSGIAAPERRATYFSCSC